MRPVQKIVALTYEMTTIEEALACARILAEAISTEGLSTEGDERRAPRAITAVLVLVMERIRLIRKAMMGDLNPSVLWHPGNDALPEGSEGRGPCLPEWPLVDALVKAQSEAQRISIQIEYEKHKGTDAEPEEDDGEPDAQDEDEDDGTG